MSVLIVGLSHRSAPVATLERAAVSGDPLGKLLRDIYEAEPVAGTFVVSTCNRVEVYAEVDKFHAGLSAISDLLARYSGIPLTELTGHLYVRYEDRAVRSASVPRPSSARLSVPCSRARPIACRTWPRIWLSPTTDRKSTRLNSSHITRSRMPSSA